MLAGEGPKPILIRNHLHVSSVWQTISLISKPFYFLLLMSIEAAENFHDACTTVLVRSEDPRGSPLLRYL